ncbi:Serine--tRNA ligase [Capsicum baccatum]|uniref:serine--tRNA ligase n=1 Tax=Capsicum baccatum TaxID=33114 RepID=A0A2G2W836_CAPBA|nr:Serine--tRNA ligase [Capsicum baccatum]
MLDINLFREEKGHNPEIIRESQRRRFTDVSLVDQVIQLDREWRQCQFEVEKLQRDINTITKEFKELKVKSKDASQTIEEKAENEERLKKKKAVHEELKAKKNVEVQEVRAALYSKLEIIGNLVHDSVPVSDDEANNAIVRSWGERRTEKGLKNHVDLVEALGIADLTKGKGYIEFMVLDFLHLLSAIFLWTVLSACYFGCLKFPWTSLKLLVARRASLILYFDRSLVKGDDKYLIATAEQPLCAYHLDDWIHPSQLPIRYAGYSSCFRKEAGSHGHDTLGIFRVHQFEKVEQFCLTSPRGDDSWDMHEEMLKNSEEFFQQLKIPYQVVAIVSGALNDAAAKKYDLEGWYPASSTYRELVSCSNFTDYQSRKLEIRFGQRKGNEDTKQYVHLLNSTLTATERTICCILENYQREDGVEIPEVLRPYMGGKTFMPFQAPPAKEAEGNKAKA